jgi:hypothetical protein
MFMALGSYPGKPEHNSADGRAGADGRECELIRVDLNSMSSMSLAFHHLLHHPISLHKRTHKSIKEHTPPNIQLHKHRSQWLIPGSYSIVCHDLFFLNIIISNQSNRLSGSKFILVCSIMFHQHHTESYSLHIDAPSYSLNNITAMFYGQISGLLCGAKSRL